MERNENELRRCILGLWDGHDSGVALVTSEGIEYAGNEERFSRRKLDVGFPVLSLSDALDYAKRHNLNIVKVACTTSDVAKTLTRYYPSLAQEYYLIRRRKKEPGALSSFKKRGKYWLTELPKYAVTTWLTKRILRQQLAEFGHDFRLGRLPISVVEHHTAHVAAAVLCSGFDRCLGVSLDGIGDASSGSIWTYEKGQFVKRAAISGKTSFGLFFEHVTNLLNMRELEDEGKVMALANFAYPVPDQDNPFLSYFDVDGLNVRAKFSTLGMYDQIKKVLWRFPPEQFAYLAQRTLEVNVTKLIANAVKQLGCGVVAYSGGVASNIKVNRLIRNLPEVERLFVFPHMGDGGLASGAAIWEAKKDGVISHLPRISSAALGPEIEDEKIEKVLGTSDSLVIEQPDDLVSRAVEILVSGEVLFWFQGRMEYGPRALGQRSILALANSYDIKNDLNLRLKRRVWYQPFCPSMLENDAIKMLEDYDGDRNAFMTGGYMVRKEYRSSLQGVINVDGSCRPQILSEEDITAYGLLLKGVRVRTGVGVLLNTSFNLHGEPLVSAPEDALRTFSETDVPVMVMGKFLIRKR